LGFAEETASDMQMQIREASESISSRKKAPFSLKGLLFRTFGWWAGFSWLYGLSAQCPFCNQPGCPVGPMATGLIGGLFSLLIRFFSRKPHRHSDSIHQG
jgi:hypothetical protein